MVQIADQLILCHRRWAELLQNALVKPIFRQGRGILCFRLWEWQLVRLKRSNNIFGAANKGGPVTDQDIAARGPPVERVSGDRQNLSPLIKGVAGGDQAA